MSVDARRALDQVLRPHRDHPTPLPPRGWIRAIRDAMGMTAEQLAERMGVTRQAVTQLERSEAQGTVTLASLRRAAEALGCSVQYVLVPEEPLEQRVTERARAQARELLSEVEHTMALEDDPVDLDHRISELAAELQRRGGLWER